MPLASACSGETSAHGSRSWTSSSSVLSSWRLLACSAWAGNTEWGRWGLSLFPPQSLFIPFLPRRSFRTPASNPVS